MSSTSFKILALFFAVSAVLVASQNCGLTTYNGYTYDLSPIVNYQYSASDASYIFSACSNSIYCGGYNTAACINNQVPLAIYGGATQFSFVNPWMPQFGIIATYPALYTGLNVNRTLSVLFTCGENNDSEIEKGFVAGGITQLFGGDNVAYGFIIPTPIMCPPAVNVPQCNSNLMKY